MSEKQPEILAMLCAALELETKEKEFYEKAIKDCPEESGKEVFRILLADEEEHARGIRQIYDSLRSGRPWPEACGLLQRPGKDIRETIREIAKRHGAQIAKGTNLQDALQIGLDMERASVKFYEDLLEKASAPEEKDFLKKMTEEEKAHRLLLLDMQFYYSDPEGYFMEKEHRGLDGA
jgi:bacterioferritin (cytochrome b1)